MRPLKTSLVTRLLYKLSLAGHHTVTYHEQIVLEPRVPSGGVVPGKAQFANKFLNRTVA